MKAILVLTSLLGVALARPEAGYAYERPGGVFDLRGQQSGSSSSSIFSGASSSSGQSFLNFNGGSSSHVDLSHQAPTVHKHIYVHVPPAEHEVRTPQYIPPVQQQRHYKIIFIKAPVAPAPVAPIIPVQHQNEEKTLVYVLVKKPEPQPEIVIPQPDPTIPSKPEVYFIKYKTQKEQVHGGHVGSSISGGSHTSGGLLTTLDGSASSSGSSITQGLFGSSSGGAASVSTAYGPPGYKSA